MAQSTLVEINSLFSERKLTARNFSLKLEKKPTLNLSLWLYSSLESYAYDVNDISLFGRGIARFEAQNFHDF